MPRFSPGEICGRWQCSKCERQFVSFEVCKRGKFFPLWQSPGDPRTKFPNRYQSKLAQLHIASEEGSVQLPCGLVASNSRLCFIWSPLPRHIHNKHAVFALPIRLKHNCPVNTSWEHGNHIPLPVSPSTKIQLLHDMAGCLFLLLWVFHNSQFVIMATPTQIMTSTVGNSPLRMWPSPHNHLFLDHLECINKWF